MGVKVGVKVGVNVAVKVGVKVAVGSRVRVGLEVGEAGMNVAVGVIVLVCVAVEVWVLVGLAVMDEVAVGLFVREAVAVGEARAVAESSGGLLACPCSGENESASVVELGKTGSSPLTICATLSRKVDSFCSSCW